MRTATALALYFGACAAGIATVATGWGEGGYLLIPLATVLVAARARRWWLVLLPVWVPAAAAVAWVIDPDPGDGDSVDSAGSAALFALMFGAVPLAVLAGVSVGVAKLVVHARRQRATPATG
jgi:hypothetical protein